MKKFNALLFAMALVAVVAFASVAFAATTQFLGVDTNGKIVVINVDPSKTTGKITYEGYTITGAPKIGDDGHSTVKAFDYEGGIVVVSTDATNANTRGAKVYTFTTDDSGNFEYGKSYSGRISGDIRDVLTMQGNPVIVATKAIATVSNDKFIAFTISADVAFQYNSNLYVVSGDGPEGKGQIFEFSAIPDDSDHWHEKREIFGLQLGASSYVKSRDIGITPPVTVKNGVTSTVVIGDAIYITTGHTSNAGGSFDMIAIPSATNSSFMDTSGLSIKKVDSTFVSETGEYYALFEKNDALYALAKATDNDLYLSKLSMNSAKTAFTKAETILSGLKSKLNVTDATNISCDIYIADDVIGIVNHGKALAIFTENSDGGWDFVESKDFLTAAMAKTASTTPDTPVTPTTTVVDASTLATASQDNLVAATPASAISDFVTAEEASTSTVPSGAQAKIEALLKTDDKTTVTLAAKTNYTPAKDGYLLVKKAVDVSKVRVYFVEAATTTAATGDPTAATFLDADCKEMGSTGTSVYAASDKLESGKTYTLVEATVSTSSSGDDDDGSTTSSSSGGCDAGFAAVSALLALAFVKKSR